VANTSKGPDGAARAGLRGGTLPVRLAGPLEAPDWRIEWSAVAAQAVTQQIQEKLGEKLGLKPPAGGASDAKPQDVLRERLKGLFR
jgi:AsmA protein